MDYGITVLIVAAAVIALYAYRGRLAQLFGADVSTIKGSAFARVAEQEGKLIALKTHTEVKKVAALEAHAALDEVDHLLG